MAGINPTLGVPNCVAVSEEPGNLMVQNSLNAPNWTSGVAYPYGAIAGYSFAPSPWAVGTTYALGQLASFELTDGQYICCISLQASNTGNVPYFGSTYWSYVTTAWDTILGVGNFAIQFQSLVSNNVGNFPYGAGGGSTTILANPYWALCIGTNGSVPNPTQVIGAPYYVEPYYAGASETETTFNRETVNAANNSSGVASSYLQGGFQLVAQALGGNGTVRQDFNVAGALTILNPTLTFSHTTTLQCQVALTTRAGSVLMPGFNQVPALKFTSATVGSMTVNAVTGLLTGVGAGTSVITVTCGGLTASSTYTCN